MGGEEKGKQRGLWGRESSRTTIRKEKKENDRKKERQ